MSIELTCRHCGNTDQAKFCGHEQPGVYDGILYWECEACGGTFHRWDAHRPGMHSRLHAAAARFIGSGQPGVQR